LRLAGLACAVVLCVSALCGPARAQGFPRDPGPDDRYVTLRMLDGRTGVLISTTNYLVRVNHEEDAHGDWVRLNEDGTGKLWVPTRAEVLSVRATYEDAQLYYANCDADKDPASSEHAAAMDRWYPIAKILSDGVVAPNQCVGKKVPEKLQVFAKPGEFVFFVRPLNAKERLKE
jgi:hypothetical protein